MKKISKTSKPLVRQRKIGKTHITNIKNKEGNISTNLADTEKIMKYYKQLYTHKYGNEMAEKDQFFQDHKVQKKSNV